MILRSKGREKAMNTVYDFLTRLRSEEVLLQKLRDFKDVVLWVQRKTKYKILMARSKRLGITTIKN